MRMSVRPSPGSVRTGVASTPWGATPVSVTMASQPAPRRMSAWTTGKGTASQRFYRTCARLAQATGTPSPSPSAAVMEGEAGDPSVRSALSRPLWLTRNCVLMAEAS